MTGTVQTGDVQHGVNGRACTQKGKNMKKVQGSPLPLGVTVSDGQINFAAAVMGDQTCSLLLYKRGEREPALEIPMTESVGDVHFLALKRLGFPYCAYNYRIGEKVVLDPYVRRILGNEQWNQKKDVQAHEIRGSLATEEFDWEGDELPGIPEHQVISYSLHVRGFTCDRGAKVRKKGTFEGVAEKIPYLKELGINQIHCMPVYEFDETEGTVEETAGTVDETAGTVDETAGTMEETAGETAKGLCNFWGYGPSHPFAVKNAYSSCGNGARSLKRLVKALHKEGIEIVLEMPFDAGIHKLQMVECLRYYRMEYHIDGFILNPTVAPMESLYQDPVLAKTKLLHHETGFQNVMRRFLKGDEGMVPEVIYWLKHSSVYDRIFNYITTQSSFTLRDLVSYDSKHNEGNGEDNRDGSDHNFSWNCGFEGDTRKKEVLSLRSRQMKNAFFLVLLAQGTPCILSGDEFGNSQQGNNNAYCQDNPIGWLNWKKFPRYQELFGFVKRLIEIRKAYPVFTPEKEMGGMDYCGCGLPDVSYHGENAWCIPSEVSSRQLGVFYSGEASKSPDIYVAYNMHWLKHKFALPSLPKKKAWYHLISTDSDAEGDKALKDQKYIEAGPRSVVVLVGK